MRIALAQVNPTVGDVDGNTELCVRAAHLAGERGADVVVLPELVICGYPPKDLLLAEGFIAACERAVLRIAKRLPRGMTAILGTPLRGRVRGRIGNGLVALRDGKIVARYHKRLLPTYDVFDEDRYFAPGDEAVVLRVKGKGDAAATAIGLSICEDLWRGEDVGFADRYAGRPDPVAALVKKGATVIVNPSASPFVLGKGKRHRAILRGHAKSHGVFVAAVNQVGGNDDLIFDGHAAVFDPRGTLVAAGRGFADDIVCFDVHPKVGRAKTSVARAARVIDPLAIATQEELVFRALVLGVRDYCLKTGFRSAVIGLSGGIDSAVTAAIAAAALGASRVTGVLMPGPYSSEHSVSDANDLATRLGMPTTTLNITGVVDAYRPMLDPAFAAAGLKRLGESLPDLSEENLQSRVRGTAIMAWSNRSGAIVLTTGNKSEIAVGYCTLYGDMNGGLAVLSDLTKHMVYALAKWMNANPTLAGFERAPIPEGSITKPPSAELRPNQTDQDSLPEYDVLDEILHHAIELREAPATIARRTKHDLATIKRVMRLIDISEYKRRQGATGLKITSVAFGTGRRVPIAQQWRPWA